MIAALNGTLTHIESGKIHLTHLSGLTLEVLVPGYAINRFGSLVGQNIQLHTLMYLESQNQGASFVPRLAGFPTAQDKAFFELLITVKGIGNRKALRAMALPAQQIALAIADRDLATLQSLPEIGKRTAETIVVDLKNKVEGFCGAEPDPLGSNHSTSDDPSNAPDSPGPSDSNSKSNTTSNPSKTNPPTASNPSLARQALQTLVALGENRVQALIWIEQAQEQDPAPKDVGELVNAAFQYKNAN